MTIFSKILVEDKDTTGANLEVECINLPEYQDACSFFEIATISSEQNSYHGAIVLRKKLSYALQQKHQFLLKATVCNLFLCYILHLTTMLIFGKFLVLGRPVEQYHQRDCECRRRSRHSASFHW